MQEDEEGESTRAVHAGRKKHEALDAIPTPIAASATFSFASTAAVLAHFDDPSSRDEYGRYGNPTTRALEAQLAAIEDPSGGSEALAFGSGMSAIATAILALTKQGAHAIVFADGYRRTRQLFEKTLASFGVEHTVVTPGGLDEVARAMRASTRVIVAETPTNPYLHATDLPALVAIAKAHGRCKTLVDATFATPINVRPREMGIDLVVHSATKYLAGHHDVLAGCVIGAPPLVSLVRELRGVLGGVLDPQAAFLVSRGLKTLALRVARQNETALAVARALESHGRIARVFYPGLESHPSHAIAKAQMRGYGGVVSFRVRPRGGESPLDAASRVVDRFELARIAPSLGGVDTLVEQPAVMSYHELSTEERREAGIDDDLIRLAVGVEDSADVVNDTLHALEES